MESKHKPKIMVMIDWYYPGYGAGGPIQSIRNLVEALKNQFEFTILTTNKDHNSTKPYPNILPNEWTTLEDKSKVYYFSHEELNQRRLFQLIDQVSPDFIYVNSLFSVPFTFWPLRYIHRHRGKAQLLLAPRGMLHPGALRQKAFKKMLFLRFMRLTGIQRKIHWQATDQQEEKDIRKHFGAGARIFLAQNFPKQFQLPWKTVKKIKGEANCLYHSRLTPKKNLHFLLELMKETKGMSLTVVGPQEDQAFLKLCQKIVEENKLWVQFKGAIPPHELDLMIPTFHFSVLPTLGENFGHSIFEAFLGGTPALISDQTPWQRLQDRKIGWSLSLAEKESWLDAMRHMVEMNQEEYDQWSKASWKFAKDYKSDSSLKTKVLKFFIEQSLK